MWRSPRLPRSVGCSAPRNVGPCARRETVMYPRTNDELTAADLLEILDACKPVPAMMIAGTLPSAQQENANNAWRALRKKMGFDHMTVQPIYGKGYRFFS